MGLVRRYVGTWGRTNKFLLLALRQMIICLLLTVCNVYSQSFKSPSFLHMLQRDIVQLDGVVEIGMLAGLKSPLYLHISIHKSKHASEMAYNS